MKNILSIILAVVLLVFCAIPAMAALDTPGQSQDVDISHTVGNFVNNSGDSQDIDISHVVQGGYIIKIPGSIQFHSSTQITDSTDISLYDVKVPGKLSVSLNSANYNGGWRLVSARGDALGYTIAAGESAVGAGEALFECNNGTKYMHKSITFTLNGNQSPKTTYYSDTLTFTVAVVS